MIDTQDRIRAHQGGCAQGQAHHQEPTRASCHTPSHDPRFTFRAVRSTRGILTSKSSIHHRLAMASPAPWGAPCEGGRRSPPSRAQVRRTISLFGHRLGTVGISLQSNFLFERARTRPRSLAVLLDAATRYPDGPYDLSFRDDRDATLVGDRAGESQDTEAVASTSRKRPERFWSAFGTAPPCVLSLWTNRRFPAGCWAIARSTRDSLHDRRWRWPCSSCFVGPQRQRPPLLAWRPRYRSGAP